MLDSIPEFDVLVLRLFPLPDKEVALLIKLRSLCLNVETNSDTVVLCCFVFASGIFVNCGLFKVLPYHFANQLDLLRFLIDFWPVLSNHVSVLDGLFVLDLRFWLDCIGAFGHKTCTQ